MSHDEKLSDAKERAAAQRFAQNICGFKGTSLPVADQSPAPNFNDILSRIAVWRDHEPEEGETWESWYYAAFDMLLSEIKDMQKGGASQPRPDSTDARSQAAQLIWHRFSNSSTEEWAHETHQAEYLDAIDGLPTGLLFNLLLSRVNFDGMDPRTFSLAEIQGAINGAEWSSPSDALSGVHITPKDAPIESQIAAAVRAWLECPAEKRPSVQSLGNRVAEIASSKADGAPQ